MCLIVFAWQQHQRMPLLLAANRDEFHARPTAGAAFWEDSPDLLAGRDLQAGGTWLGISRRGRFAAITNVRDPGNEGRSAPRSRGELTRDFLECDLSPAAYLNAVAPRAQDYLGFNLLVGTRDALWYLHGGGAETSLPRELTPGIYALSNAALDVPWPKVRIARQRLKEQLENGETPDHDALRSCLEDRRLADAAALHDQGLSGEMARQLSAQFIVTPEYGTRCCTTLRWRDDGLQEFQEQRFDPGGELSGADSFEIATGQPD